MQAIHKLREIASLYKLTYIQKIMFKTKKQIYKLI